MALLNYTTKIDADKTASEIAKCLSMHGAQAVMTEYDKKDQTVTSISFMLDLNGKSIKFRLPCAWKPIYEILQNDPKVPQAHKDETQAVRTAWRIVKNWVEAQMALVETQMVSTEQVFLPYAVMKGGKTLGEQVLGGEFLLLGDGK